MKFDYSLEPGKRPYPASYIPGKPLVSLITPYYNANEYFPQTFQSVMNQTFPWFEWIIVDDGSTNTEAVAALQALAGSDNRVHYYHKENGGIASARNFGIRHCSADYIIPLDADDLISPVYVEINYWALRFYPDAAWSYTDSVGFGDQEYLWRKAFSADAMKVNNLLTCTAMIRKSALLSVGGYGEIQKHYNEDWHLWLNLISSGNFPVHIAGYHFWYRRSSSGVLGHVRANRGARSSSRKAIGAAAKKISRPHMPVEFPRAGKLNEYLPPIFTDWDKSLTRTIGMPGLLFLIPWLEMGGADSFNLSLAKKLASDFEISIITTAYSENTWKQRFEAFIPNIYELPNFLEVKNYAEFISYYLIAHKIRLIFLSNSYYGYYLLPWLRKHFSDIAVVDYVHMEEWYWRSGGYARTSAVFQRFIDRTYTCNLNTRNVLVDHFKCSPEHVVTSYIGVDEKYFNPELFEYGRVRRKLGLGERKIIIFPCRLDPQKRPLLMVKITAEIRRYIPDIAVLVVGDGPMREEITAAIRREGLKDTIYLLGRKEDLRPYYRDSDLTLICSIREGLSLTAYESFAMCCPVVTSDIGGQRELVDSTVGALVPVSQSASLIGEAQYPEIEIHSYAAAALNILSDGQTLTQMRAGCRHRILSRFTAEANLESLYDNMISLLQSEETQTRSGADHGAAKDFSRITDDYLTLYTEIENYSNTYNYGVDKGAKRELIRIINTPLGQKMLKLAFRLKLNRFIR